MVQDDALSFVLVLSFQIYANLKEQLTYNANSLIRLLTQKDTLGRKTISLSHHSLSVYEIDAMKVNGDWSLVSFCVKSQVLNSIVVSE